MLRWIALIAAIVCVVAFAGIIVSQSLLHPDQQEQATEHQSENANKKVYKTLWDTWFPDSLSLYTLALVVFTAILAFGGLYQLNFLERAERISAQAAQAAQDSAEATKKAVELSDRTAERQLRAYVVATKASLDRLGIGQIPKVVVELKNAGQTPAYKFRSRINIFGGPNPLPQSPPLVDGDAVSILGPGESHFLGASMTATIGAAEMAEIIAGRRTIYVQGLLKYEDAFGKERFTKFSLQYVHDGQAVAADAVGMGLQLVHTHGDNEAN
jgi:hypothetical protein